jgi:hypothetical protein
MDAPDDSRFGVALDFLREGKAIGFRGISMSLGKNGLHCCTASTWGITALTEDRAMSDLVGLRQTLDDLRAARADFADLIDGQPISLSLVQDDGMGVVELCRLVDGRIEGLAHC